jgi:hypothetical protein
MPKTTCMTAFDQFSAELQQLTPFRIRYKDEAWEMQALNLLVMWFCPQFMSRFTTVIGSTIYFPSRLYLQRYPKSAMRVLAHEVVHILDAERVSFPAFMLGYLFPQILTLGVFAFPWLGPWALLFLLFALPWPAPFRFHFESRAYALDYLTTEASHREAALEGISHQFGNWEYYRMYPRPEAVARQVKHWAQQAETGEDKTLLKVLLVYEMADET